MKHIIASLAFLLCAMSCARAADDAPAAADPKKLFEEVKGKIDAKSIDDLFVDSASGSVSAASIAKIEPNAVTVVENVRGFSMMTNALDANAKGFGLSITPARIQHPFPRISLGQYARGGMGQRLLASVNFSYAQGKEDVSGTSYTRRAFSVATSAFFDPSQDPVVVLAEDKGCRDSAFDALDAAGIDQSTLTVAAIAEGLEMKQLEADAARGSAEKKAAAEARLALLAQQAAAGLKDARRKIELVNGYRTKRLAGEGDPAAKAEVERERQATIRLSPEHEKLALDAFNTCAAKLLKGLEDQWNRSRFSVSWATGAIKPTSGSDSQTLGRTLALSAMYGFEHLGPLKDYLSIALTLRNSRKEPVLTSLGTDSVQFKNHNLVAMRLAGGSSTLRLLGEISNAKDRDITGSQTDMRRAIGIDFRAPVEGLWLHLRYGRQRKADGQGDETGSFLTLSYSPGALLGH